MHWSLLGWGGLGGGGFWNLSHSNETKVICSILKFLIYSGFNFYIIYLSRRKIIPIQI